MKSFQRRDLAWFLLLLVNLVWGLGCSTVQEQVRLTAEGKRAPMRLADEDPFRLLPPGAIAWWRVDAQELFESNMGPALLASVEEKLSPAVEAGLDLERDVETLIGALYATAGSDVVVVAQGKFDELNLASALNESGNGVISTSFSGETLFVFEGATLALLSDRTLVMGSQLGVRRAVERIEEGRLVRNTPSWFDALMKSRQAHLQFGMDLDSQPVPAAFRAQASFLKTLRAARIVGNFRGTTVNLAGTMTYETPARASDAAEKLHALQKDLGKYQLLLTALQLGRPIRDLDAKPTGKDTQVTMQLDSSVLGMILENADQLLQGTEEGAWLPN